MTLFAVAMVALVGCGDKGDDSGMTDGGMTDGGMTDGGVADGGMADGGTADGGGTDGGGTDGGGTDGGGTDGGGTDGGGTDGGGTDGGGTDGGGTDGGGTDGGATGDGGSEEGVLYTGTITVYASDSVSGQSDTCKGTASVTVTPTTVAGGATCDFSGPFAMFGTTAGPIGGKVDPDGNVTAIWDTAPSPLAADMTGTVTAELLELTFAGKVPGEDFSITYDGVLVATP